MRIIKVEYSHTSGSCYHCQRIFDTFKYFVDMKYKYDKIRCFLNYYDNFELKVLWRIIFNKKELPEKRSEAIKKLSKEMEVRGW